MDNMVEEQCIIAIEEESKSTNCSVDIEQEPPVYICNLGEENQPTQSPRIRKHNKTENCSSEAFMCSENTRNKAVPVEDRKLGKDCRVSISCFNNLIKDLYLHSADVEQNISKHVEDDTESSKPGTTLLSVAKKVEPA